MTNVSFVTILSIAVLLADSCIPYFIGNVFFLRVSAHSGTVGQNIDEKEINCCSLSISSLVSAKVVRHSGSTSRQAAFLGDGLTVAFKDHIDISLPI